MKKIFLIGVILFLLIIIFGCTQPKPANENSFAILEGGFCTEEGKPIIRMYSTTICPHCKWVGPAFDEVVKKYVDANKIVAYHWQLDTGDNTLTNEVEKTIDKHEQAVFNEFSPKGFVPAFVFGCKYYRIGTQFEAQKDLNSEKLVFTQIIEELLKEN